LVTALSAKAILADLRCGRAGCDCHKYHTVHCPSHTDGNPSFQVTEGEDGKILVKCFGGCAQEQVIAALRERGLWDGKRDPLGLTLEQFAEAKGLDPDFLRQLGIRETLHGFGRDRRPCVEFPYANEGGEITGRNKRLALTGPAKFRRDGNATLYGLDMLEAAKDIKCLLVVEGESDQLTLRMNGIPAIGVPGANNWRSDWVRYFQGIEIVLVWHEPDRGGDALVPKIGVDFPELRVIEAPVGVKDPNALWLTMGCDRHAFQRHIRELAQASSRYSDIRAEALSEEARETYKTAAALLEAPGLMKLISDVIREEGYAGDVRPPVLAYLALTSRLLECPLNLAFIAASASGKNRAVDAALELMPPSAYYMVKAGSARSLVYSEESFSHRVVVFAEADSIPDDGPAASAVRSIASDNSMEYDVTERNEETGHYAVRRIHKPGPTGLITTSTRPLPSQMDTRVLSLGIPDRPEHTRAVLAAHAAAVNGKRPHGDVRGFIALQRWLELAGEHRVTVPFSYALAEAVPADQVRMRRDFRQLLTTIQSVALLHQCQRERDDEGRIIASKDDYRIARDLLLDTFTSAATGGVSATVRETVVAVASLFDGERPVTATALAARLGLSKAATSDRVKRAVSLGFVVNQETQRGMPHRLILGDPIPDEVRALPDPDSLGYCPEEPRTAEHASNRHTCGVSEDECSGDCPEPVEDPSEHPERAAADTERSTQDVPVRLFGSKDAGIGKKWKLLASDDIIDPPPVPCGPLVKYAIERECLTVTGAWGCRRAE